MKRLIVFCEGLTEENFVKTVLDPYLSNIDKDMIITPINAGGVSKYSIIKRDLIRICKGDPTATITTMFDYYGSPKETPGVDTSSGTIYQKVQHIEASVEEDLKELENLIFNLIMHEYEGLLFTRTSAFEIIANKKQLAALKEICENKDIETPEHINNSYDTAPSKRLEKIIPGYSKKHKVSDGVNIAFRIGIDGISAKCKHFERWMGKLIDWARDGAQ